MILLSVFSISLSIAQRDTLNTDGFMIIKTHDSGDGFFLKDFFFAKSIASDFSDLIENESIPGVNYLLLHKYLAKEGLRRFTDTVESFKDFDFSTPLFVYKKGYVRLDVFYIRSTYYIEQVMLKEYLAYEVSHSSYFSKGHPERMIELVYPINMENLLK